MQLPIRLFLVGAIMAAVAGCATNPVTGNPNFVLMSEEQEIALGRQYHEQVMKEYTEYKDPALNALVQRLGKELAAESHRNELEWTFTLLDSPEVNAFATPGGYVYITRGIIAYMNSEEELAGVLGHEIGHVTARHGVRQQSAQTSAGLVSGILAAVTGVQAVGQVSNALGQVAVRGYGRNHELEADRLGAEYLAETGYDPEKMLGVVGLLKDQEEFEKARAQAENREPRTYHGVFSTHPRNDQRLQEVVRAAEKFRNPNPKQTNPEEFLKTLDGVAFGSSEEQGVLRGNKFYHKGLDLGLTLPPEWKVDNQPTQLVVVSPGQDRAIIITIADASTSPEQYLRSNYQNLQSLQSIGGDAYTGIAQLPSGSGQRPARVAATRHQGKIIGVNGLSKSGQILPDDEIYEVVRSVRSLNAEERKLASAKKIDLVRAKPGDSFASLAKESDLEEYAEEQLRLLNGKYPDGEPAPGEMVKIIR